MPATSPRVLPRLPIILVVVAVLVLAACGNSDDNNSASSSTTAKSGGTTKITGVPGVTDTEIHFSSFGTDSNNPLGNCVLKCFDDGIKAYFAYRNSQGGVDGRKLVLTKELDDRLGENQQRALEIVSANDTFASFSATQIASGWKEIAKAGIPLYVWNIHPERSGIRSIFGPSGAICFDCTSRFNAYITSLVKAKKVASLGYGVSENSKLAAQGVKKTLEKYNGPAGGAQVVYLNDHLDFGLPNGVAPEVTAMKKAGVQLVFGSLDLNGMKKIAEEMERQGIGDVPQYHPNTYDQTFVKNAGKLFVGDYVGVQFRPFESDSAGSMLSTYKEWMRKQRAPITEISMVGWINADIAYQGLKAAGSSFDRAKVIDATLAIKRYTAGGLTEPQDFGRQFEPPTEQDIATHGPNPDCFAFVKVDNTSTFQMVGDAAKPWVCFPGTSRDWSDPTRTNFK